MVEDERKEVTIAGRRQKEQVCRSIVSHGTARAASAAATIMRPQCNK
jgi:hypothetical protein